MTATSMSRLRYRDFDAAILTSRCEEKKVSSVKAELDIHQKSEKEFYLVNGIQITQCTIKEKVRQLRPTSCIVFAAKTCWNCSLCMLHTVCISRILIISFQRKTTTTNSNSKDKSVNLSLVR